MRIGLISALRRSEDAGLRAVLPLAGRSVLAWQATLLGSLGVGQIICLIDTATACEEVLKLQHALEAGGTAFHALKNFASIPALVRADDNLVILADGLLPDPAIVRVILGGEGALACAVATIPADHQLAAEHPEDFERIDAARCWAGVLAMRGAPVQQLAGMPADADAISVVLRLALQAGTPGRDITNRDLLPENWLLAVSNAALAKHETGLVARAASPADWRAPGMALASALVRALSPRGLAQGALMAGGLGLALLLGAVLSAAFGSAAVALTMAGLGAFAAQVTLEFTRIASRLQRNEPKARASAVLGVVVDIIASLTLWFSLAPWPAWEPLAALGPSVVGLARIVARASDSPLAPSAPDRASLLLLLAAAAMFGWLPEAISCLALGLLTALLLRRSRD